MDSITWVGIAVGCVIAAVVVCFLVIDKCPMCGSRLKKNAIHDEDGHYNDHVCFRCGHSWVPEWVLRARERGE